VKALLLVMLAACSVEKLPPIRMVHAAGGAMPHRVVVLPTECTASDWATANSDPRAWCAGVDAIVAAELAFRGVEVVDLSKLPARERTREEVEVTTTIRNETTERRKVTVVGPTFSDVDMWTRRDALEQLGVDGIVRVRAAHTATWPVRTLALVRVTRPRDASLVAATVCELETSRLDSDADTTEKALRCALGGLPR
jgi:hypothetical protein